MCNDTRKGFASVKIVKKMENSRVNAIENKRWKLLTNHEDVVERWREDCHRLYNHSAIVNNAVIEEETGEESEEAESPVLRSAVKEAITHLISNKAPDINSIYGESIKEGGKDVADILLKIDNERRKSGQPNRS